MRWHDLLFLHRPVEPAALRALLPAGLELDTFEGAAWLGVVPFRMNGVRPRWVPPLPGVSAFAELNLRTYVTAQGKPGVWFFTLEAASRLAVWTARAAFHLPYHHAAMAVRTEGDGLHFASRRDGPRGPVAFEARYRPSGPVRLAEPGSLEAWLTERYALYAADRHGRLFRGDVHHDPWPLQPAEVTLERETLAGAHGLQAAAGPPHVLFARRLDVFAWWLERVPVRGESTSALPS